MSIYVYNIIDTNIEDINTITFRSYVAHYPWKINWSNLCRNRNVLLQRLVPPFLDIATWHDVYRDEPLHNFKGFLTWKWPTSSSQWLRYGWMARPTKCTNLSVLTSEQVVSCQLMRCRRYPGLDYSSKTSGFWAQKFVKQVTLGPLGTPKWYCWDLNLRTWIPVPQDMSLVIIGIRLRMTDCAMSEFQMLHFTNLKFHWFQSKFGMLVPATFESLSDMNSTRPSLGSVMARRCRVSLAFLGAWYGSPEQIGRNI